MIVNNIPSFEEMPLVHSETILMDLAPIGQRISESALRQLGNAKVKLENLLMPGATVAQGMGPNLISDINVFRANLLAFKPTYDQDLIEFYNYSLLQGAQVSMSLDQFIQLVYDTAFKIYHIYNFFFSNLFAEIRQKCVVLGFPNVNIVIHVMDVQHAAGRVSIGCYAR